jgi:hypothetical protein
LAVSWDFPLVVLRVVQMADLMVELENSMVGNSVHMTADLLVAMLATRWEPRLVVLLVEM